MTHPLLLPFHLLAATAGRVDRGLVVGTLRRRITRTRPIVVLTTGRAGSTLLLRLLATHPDVASGGEALHGPAGPSPRRIVSNLTAHAAAAGTRAVALSIPTQHLVRHGVDPVEAVADLHERGALLVTLVREDPVALGLSMTLAAESGRWHQAHPGEQPGPSVLDPRAVLRAVLASERTAHDVARLVGLRSHLALTYERDLRDAACHQATVDAVVGRAGLAHAPVGGPGLVRREGDWPEQVANWDEVRAALATTRWAPWLPAA